MTLLFTFVVGMLVGALLPTLISLLLVIVVTGVWICAAEGNVALIVRQHVFAVPVIHAVYQACPPKMRSWIKLTEIKTPVHSQDVALQTEAAELAELASVEPETPVVRRGRNAKRTSTDYDGTTPIPLPHPASYYYQQQQYALQRQYMMQQRQQQQQQQQYYYPGA